MRPPRLKQGKQLRILNLFISSLKQGMFKFPRSTPAAGDDFFDGVAKDAQKVMNREIRLDELKRSCDAGVSLLID